jgi:hypothetical protein
LGITQDVRDRDLSVRRALNHDSGLLARPPGKVLAGSGQLLEEPVSLLEENVSTSHCALDQVFGG